MKNKIQILDCTLRDGGYYNNWNFNTNLVNKYFKTIDDAKIDAVELGYRFIDKSSSYGKFAYLDEIFLKNLKIKKNLLKFVMINSSDFFLNNKIDYKIVEKNFLNINHTIIDGIRIAVNIKDYKKCKILCKIFHNYGYKICLNLMQASNKNNEFYKKLSSDISKWNTVDVLYFADSLGNMMPQEVYDLTKIFKKYFNKKIGVHLHNNKGFGLINSVYAANAGINWIDSTILGMGRGSGNVPTETLLLEMNNLKLHNGNIYKIENILSDFEKLQKKYKWGNNLYYHLSANSNIHPTYAQTLLTEERYEKNKILNSLFYLSKKKSTSFNQEKLRDSLFSSEKISIGSWNSKKWLDKKNILIIGAGSSIKNNKKKIINYIKLKKPFVIALNINKYINEKYVDATVVCHETRVIIDSIKYKNLNKILIMPKKNFQTILNDKDLKCRIYDYGINIRKDIFKSFKNYCIISKPLVAAYTLAIISNSNTKKIETVGFDGFDEGDIRNNEMNDIFDNFHKTNKNKIIHSLTPTSYKIKQKLNLI